MARFARGAEADTPPLGRDAYDAFKGTGSAFAAFIDLAEQAGAEIVTPIAAGAWPSGPVEDAAYQYMTDIICDAVAAMVRGKAPRHPLPAEFAPERHFARRAATI